MGGNDLVVEIRAPPRHQHSYLAGTRERWENLSLRWCHHRKQKDRLLGYGGMLSVS